MLFLLLLPLGQGFGGGVVVVVTAVFCIACNLLLMLGSRLTAGALKISFLSPKGSGSGAVVLVLQMLACSLHVCVPLHLCMYFLHAAEQQSSGGGGGGEGGCGEFGGQCGGFGPVRRQCCQHTLVRLVRGGAAFSAICLCFPRSALAGSLLLSLPFCHSSSSSPSTAVCACFQRLLFIKCCCYSARSLRGNFV